MRASIKSTPHPSSEISNRSLNDIAEERSAPIVTNLDIGRKTAVFTNAHTATYTNPTTRNTYASSNHSDLTADPKHPSNKNRHHHHPSPSASLIKEVSKTENPHPLSHHPPCLPPPAEESPKTKERERRKTITPANKGKSKERSTGLSMISRKNGTEGWRNSPNNRTNPTNMTTKPSTTSTRSHLDFRSSWKFRTIDGG